MKTKSINLSAISLLTIFAFISACHSPNNIENKVDTGKIKLQISRTNITGKIEFPESQGFETKASVNTLSTQSTVSIIYPPDHPSSANKTIATGLTDNSGAFIINPSATFSPALNEIFILEAEKRIGRTGQTPLAISTYIKWNGSGWSSITSPNIIINSKTTAITILSGLNPTTISADNTINKIQNGTVQNINATVTSQTVNDVATLVNNVLSNNYDPVQLIGKKNGNYIIIIPQPIATPTPIAEFKVNTYSTGTKSTPAIAIDNNGNYVVTWAGQGANDVDGIFARKFNSTGTPLSDEFMVNTFTTGQQIAPAVAIDNNTGNFVIAWQSTGPDGDSAGIFAQRYNSAAQAQGNETQLNTYTTSSQAAPAIAMNDSGDFVVSWTSFGQDGSQEGIYGRKFDSQGIPKVPEFPVNTYTTGFQRDPSIAMNNNGSFVISWDNPGVYIQRFDTYANRVGSETLVSNSTTGSDLSSAVANDSSGNFVVTWRSFQKDGDGNGISARIYNNGGTNANAEFIVNAYTTLSQDLPAIAMNQDNGNFVVSWTDSAQDGSSTGVYARRFNNSGTPLSNDFLVNTFTANGQTRSAAAMNTSDLYVGNFVLTWTSANQNGSTSGIYGKLYDSNGNPL
jgi:phosphoheptose isomerase